MAAAKLIFCSLFFAVSSVQAETEDKDSLFSVYEYHGALLEDSTTGTIEKIDIQRIHYNTMYDILDLDLGVYGLSTGQMGHYNNFLNYGSIDNDNSMLFNGRELTEYHTGKYNFELFSPEFFERIEVLRGSDAVVLSPTPNSMSFNLQEIKHNTAIPFTRIWYAQEGGQMTAADGIFSQNFAHGWNFTFGFKRLTENLDFENLLTDYWNVRGILRYNIDSNSSISLTDKFTNNKLYMNGGSDPELSVDIYDPSASRPYYTDLRERNYRHDVDLTYTGEYGIFSITNTSFYVNSLTIREYEQFIEDENYVYDPNNTEIQYGNRLNLKFDIEEFEIISGGSFTHFEYDKTNYFDAYSGEFWNLFSRAKISLLSSIDVSGGINVGNNSKTSFAGFGERITYNSENLKLYFDHSLFEKTGRLMDPGNLKETNNLFLTGLELSNGIDISLTSYYRIVNNAIYYELVNDYHSRQINLGNYNAAGGSFSISGEVLSNIFDESDKIKLSSSGKLNKILINEELQEYYPLFDLSAGIHYKLMINRSELNIGFNGRIIGSKRPPRYIPLDKSYVLAESSIGNQFDGFNAYAIMKLGNAFVKIEFEDLLNSGYYLVSYYPEAKRTIRLSAAWSFFK